MSERRRNKPANRWGCKPVEDVCVQHDRPLECRHGCSEVKPHSCKELLEAINAELAKIVWEK